MELFDESRLFDLVNRLSLEYFHKPFRHYVQFNNRLRTTGGRYLLDQKVIELNPKYIIEIGEQELIGIIKHELCHYHLHIEGKGYRHGDEDFKRLLKETGSPRYCKPLPSNEKRYRYFYMCKTCQCLYKRVRRVNTNKYRCGKCKGEIVLQ